MRANCGVYAALIAAVLGSASAEPRLLTPLLRANRLSEARASAAVSINGTDFGFSGFFSEPAQHKADHVNHIFWWYQPCTDCNASEAPLLVWLQGGPGGPGTFGAMTEIGNWWIDEELEPHDRCFSWCKKNSCLFVDQPVEAGFSFQTDASGAAVTDITVVDFTDTSPAAMAQIHGVVTQFFSLFPELQPAPLVITGESYGGLYTPNLGVLLAADPEINFQALSVGDPCINWEHQFPTYADTLYGMGVLMKDEREHIRTVMAAASEGLKAYAAGTGTCRGAFSHWNAVWDDDGHDSGGDTTGLFAAMTGSTMTEDILMNESPPGFGPETDWFNKKHVATAFGVLGVSAKQPADSSLGLKVYDVFVDSGDWCTKSSHLYAELLDSTDIDLMIYSSTMDPLLGPPTTEAGIDAILLDAVAVDPTRGAAIAAAFHGANKTLWSAGTDDGVAGYAKCADMSGLGRAAVKRADGTGRRFCYVVVRNAGHMTPAFQPRAAREMIGRFLEGRSFDKRGVDPLLPQCAACGGAGPFAGDNLPACAKQ